MKDYIMSDKEKTKVCIRCKEEKPLSKFFKHPKTKDGLYRYCSRCSYIAITKKKDKKHVEDYVNMNMKYLTDRDY